jgi:CBS domain containing-hemolysin-like protein
MSLLAIAVLVLLTAVYALASYIRRVYDEYGKILTHEVEENLNAWEKLVEPHLGLTREHAALSAIVLEQLTLGLIALEVGALLFDRSERMGPPTPGEIAQALLALILVFVFSNQLLPALLFLRTRGRWVRAWTWPVRLLLWLTTPITVFIRFFFSVASLAEPPVSHEEETAVDVEALLEAGQEEGILEESDRDLVRSAVEFGDKLVKEVMTPRPQIFAVPASTTLEQFLELLREHNFSRVPVYSSSIDEIIGLAFAHDLLQITDTDACARTVQSILRPVEFVPETKRVYELLREMQREKQHMSIVVDEYGGVAGLVTIEDLLEEIVGEIRDEHETDSDPTAADSEPIHETANSWLVPGSFPIDRLENLFGHAPDLDGECEATTLGGLVSEREGRIPLPGEVVLLEDAGLRIEILASTDRRIDRLRVFPPAESYEKQE